MVCLMHCLSSQSLFWKLRKSNFKFNCAKVILTKCFTKKPIIIITEKGIFLINLQEVASVKTGSSLMERSVNTTQNKEKLYFLIFSITFIFWS